MAENYGTMQTRIASDLELTATDATISGRTWADEIKAAITDAIKLYKTRRWWFLQQPNAVTGTKTGVTVGGNAYVADPTGLISLNAPVRITINGQLLERTEVSESEMRQRKDGYTANNQPNAFCRYGKRIELDPTPNDVYTLTFTGYFECDALTNDSDTNDWMSIGEILIRSHAKLILLRDVIENYQRAEAMQPAIADAIEALDREHVMRSASRHRIRRRS